MAAVTANNTEIIPGYKLLERLGHGGFGEVWKAEAPGGFYKAIKIVYGNLESESLEDEGGRARQELKSLERVKAVRHPFILSLERFDIVKGKLLIVMELADKNLMDRFLECRAQDLPGIPRDELLRYMEEAAEALDLMNIEHQLQHLDIKPQNLFLVYNHVKVADFGLVKGLEGLRTQVTGGVTAVYAPPETFDGVISRYCDQYALAIVYQEMLTGKLPYSGKNPRQLMLQHMTGKPNLEPLPACDRDALTRALSKKPEERFPSCREFVFALRHGSVTPPATGKSTGVLPAAPVRAAPALVPTYTPPPSTLFSTQETATAPKRTRIEGEGVLFPALIIGLGAAGQNIVRQLRKSLHKRCGPLDALPNLRFLLIDTDPDDLRAGLRGEAETALKESETLLTRLQRPSHYIKPGPERHSIEQWLPPNLLSHLPRDQAVAGGLRVLGRLAFAGNYGAMFARLAAELEACIAPEALAAAQKRTGLGLRTNWPRVYVITSLGGGTGGGMFLDLAYALKRHLRRLGFTTPEIVGLFALPAAVRGPDKDRALANCYAALTELSYFSDANSVFTANYKEHFGLIVDRDPPFNQCFFLPLPKEEQPASLQELSALAGDFLCRDLTTPLGKAAESERTRRLVYGRQSSAFRCQTLGSFWFAVPRRLLLKRVAQKICHRLVQDWRDFQPKALEEKIHVWLQSRFTERRFDAEHLAAELRERAGANLGNTLTAAVDEVLAPFLDELRNPTVANEAIKALEKFVGGPSDGATATGSAETGWAFAKAVATVGANLEPSLADLSLRVLAEPHFRLLGVEERVQSDIGDMFAQRARAHRVAAHQLLREATGYFERLTPALQALRQKSSFFGSWGKKGGPSSEDAARLLKQYGAARVEAIVQLAVSALYQDLKESFKKHLRNVGCCRLRTETFLKSFDIDARGKLLHVDLGLGQYLLPAGCRTLPEAVEQILACLTPEEMVEINQRVQEQIGRKFQAHVHVCTAPADLFRTLEEEILQQVAAFAEAPLGRAHAATLYVEQRAHDGAVYDELTAAFDEAAPKLAVARLHPDEAFSILAVPPGPEGDYFRALVQHALPNEQFIPVQTTDDIVFYREAPELPLAALPQMGPAAQEAYRQALQSDLLPPHSRFDIPEWLQG
ncbi:MAG: protein kinase [Gemmataceae bacterium]|nr:protein kinase [Gemmataceae bacterium]MCI0740805.1 protein kinase [Gemmataceae bacterium]